MQPRVGTSIFPKRTGRGLVLAVTMRSGAAGGRLPAWPWRRKRRTDRRLQLFARAVGFAPTAGPTDRLRCVERPRAGHPVEPAQLVGRLRREPARSAEVSLGRSRCARLHRRSVLTCRRKRSSIRVRGERPAAGATRALGYARLRAMVPAASCGTLACRTSAGRTRIGSAPGQ